MCVQDTFYTDSNGREMQKRVINYRPTWPLEVFEPVAGNCTSGFVLCVVLCCVLVVWFALYRSLTYPSLHPTTPPQTTR